jgi:hypothetical protein
MKYLLILLLLPTLLHARPLIIQIHHQTDLDLQEFEDWANAVATANTTQKGLRKVRRIKVVESTNVYPRPIRQPQTFSEWGGVTKYNLDSYRYELGLNLLGPVLRRSNILSIPGTLADGTRFVGGMAYVTGYPRGYTDPTNWTSGVAYTANFNATGADRRLQSFVTILHEAFHTLGVNHAESRCDLMYPAVLADYSMCRQGIIINPLANDLAATTIFKSVRDFRRKLKRCRNTGREKKSCIYELLRARNTLPVNTRAHRRVHNCQGIH